MATIVVTTIETLLGIGVVAVCLFILYFFVYGVDTHWSLFSPLLIPGIPVISLFIIYRVAKRYRDN